MKVILLVLTFASILLKCKTQAIPRLLVPMTVVQNAAATGALCLDGCPPAYHFDKGSGEGASNWLLQFEGGGWCHSMLSCRERAPTRRGSTKFMDKSSTFNGILSNNAVLNPDFHNWNRVKIRYCDGGSFLGDSQAKDPKSGSMLYFRGQRIWQAIIQDLLPKGLGQAKMALLGGCSAGGLATFLHCDNFTSYLPKTATVKCFSDAGFFMDASDIGLNHTMKDLFTRLVALHGAEQNLDKTCRTGRPAPAECIFPQYFLQNIKTPMFALNTAYDVFQIGHILVPPSSDPRGDWKKCKADPAACNPDQLTKLQGFRNDMLTALRPLQSSESGGLFINSCFSHCQSEIQDTWLAADSPKIDNKKIAEAVGDWYFNRAVSKREDIPYPSDTTCKNLLGVEI